LKKRILGRTDLELSVIGLGTWAMAGTGWKHGWGPQDDTVSIRTIHRAVDLGINWIDTAAVYGAGHSEEVVGAALAGMTEKPFVATKCGRFLSADGGLTSDIHPESIRREVEQSLRRLRLERIDLYQVHWPNPDPDIEAAWETMADLVREGKIRWPAVSNFNASQIQRLLPIRPVASNQVPYSLLRRDIEQEILPFCAGNGIGILAYSPLQKGLLSGKFSPVRSAGLPATDHRTRDPMFHEPVLPKILDFVERLKTAAGRNGMTPAGLAVAWTLSQPGVSGAIVGSRSPEQLEETTGAGDRLLSKPEEDAIRALLAECGL
jgi:aryl-alcohol dehydrogenase-like predicted oxidoreductase